jgi:hypothetical protein
MIEGMATLTNANQGNLHAVQGQAEQPQGTTRDVVEGKVNPSDKPENMFEESNSQEKSYSQDMLGSDSREGDIVDLLG